MQVAAEIALAVAAAGHRHHLRLRLLARRRSDLGAVRHRGRPALHRRADHDGGPAQRLHAGRDDARPAHRRSSARTWPTRPARTSLGAGEGQGRRLQGDLGTAEAVRRQPRLQLAARRGQHRRPRHRPGHPRAQAGGRDPVLRLHLAGVHADPQRAGAHALALEQRLQLAGGDPGHLRRLPEGRRRLPLADRRVALHRRFPGCASSAPPPRSTPTACCAPPSAATTRCSSSSTSTCTARPTTRRRIPARTS